MTQYETLLQVSEVLLEHALRSHRSNLRDSAIVQANIDQLEALRSHAQNDAETRLAQQIIGADTLFQGWAMQKRRELNRRAAMTRAAEIESHAHASLAFSRREATLALIEADRKKARARRDALQTERIEAIGILRAFKSQQ